MSDIDKIEYFIEVAQSENITKSAAFFGISKAALSKNIKALEASLNIDLFHRKGQRLHLSPQGELLLTQALRLKRELDDTRNLCKTFHESPSGPLKIVAFPYFAKQLIFPKLPAFLKQYPKLNVIIDTSERIPHFDKEQVDIALGFSLPIENDEDIVQKTMGTTHYVLCASSDYLKKQGTPETLDALNRHHYIDHVGRSKTGIKLGSSRHFPLIPRLLVNTADSLIDCAKAGLGFIQLPIYMVEDLLKTGELIAVLQHEQRSNEPIYYYYPKYRYIQPKVRKFIDFFITAHATAHQQ